MNAQKTFLTLVLFLLCACAKAGSDSASAQSNNQGKPALFSRWISDDLTTTIDFKNGALDQPFSFTWSFKSGAICTSNIIINGDDYSFGTAVISNSAYVSGGSGDPGCAALDSNDYLSYSLAGGEMIMCPYPTGNCVHYNRLLDQPPASPPPMALK
jgi:hypothetical protein